MSLAVNANWWNLVNESFILRIHENGSHEVICLTATTGIDRRPEQVEEGY
jgi:hypothetical protein